MTVRGYHVLLVLAAACLVVGSGAFSSVSADRGMTVAIVDDESAYLGVDVPEEVFVTGGEKVDGNGDSVGEGSGNGGGQGDGEVESGDENGKENGNGGQAGDGRGNGQNGATDESGLRETDVTLIEVQNRFGFDLDVTVTVDPTVDGDGRFPQVGESERAAPFEVAFSLPSGGSEAVTVPATCPGNGEQSRTVELVVVATGESGSVELTREVTVTCS
ncbi:hypothetical protein [Halomarina oriensis]|uniref:DUF1102 domain-containing protein n=1 Tax=Halomarina oriensis TaxID=671145 RepID=A0A6B0GF16_9EURY|nr:hypothetical protein [Halomarina oriensis]MWG33546.1 hypothetical protein [Halomarina oriensis]